MRRPPLDVWKGSDIVIASGCISIKTDGNGPIWSDISFVVWRKQFGLITICIQFNYNRDNGMQHKIQIHNLPERSLLGQSHFAGAVYTQLD